MCYLFCNGNLGAARGVTLAEGTEDDDNDNDHLRAEQIKMFFNINFFHSRDQKSAPDLALVICS